MLLRLLATLRGQRIGASQHKDQYAKRLALLNSVCVPGQDWQGKVRNPMFRRPVV